MPEVKACVVFLMSGEKETIFKRMYEHMTRHTYPQSGKKETEGSK
jgi:hypothetical protein